MQLQKVTNFKYTVHKSIFDASLSKETFFEGPNNYPKTVESNLPLCPNTMHSCDVLHHTGLWRKFHYLIPEEPNHVL